MNGRTVLPDLSIGGSDSWVGVFLLSSKAGRAQVGLVFHTQPRLLGGGDNISCVSPLCCCSGSLADRFLVYTIAACRLGSRGELFSLCLNQPLLSFFPAVFDSASFEPSLDVF
jgi:hypothetical protein